MLKPIKTDKRIKTSSRIFRLISIDKEKMSIITHFQDSTCAGLMAGAGGAISTDTKKNQYTLFTHFLGLTANDLCFSEKDLNFYLQCLAEVGININYLGYINNENFSDILKERYPKASGIININPFIDPTSQFHMFEFDYLPIFDKYIKDTTQPTKSLSYYNLFCYQAFRYIFSLGYEGIVENFIPLKKEFPNLNTFYLLLLCHAKCNSTVGFNATNCWANSLSKNWVNFSFNSFKELIDDKLESFYPSQRNTIKYGNGQATNGIHALIDRISKTDNNNRLTRRNKKLLKLI